MQLPRFLLALLPLYVNIGLVSGLPAGVNSATNDAALSPRTNEGLTARIIIYPRSDWHMDLVIDRKAYHDSISYHLTQDVVSHVHNAPVREYRKGQSYAGLTNTEKIIAEIPFQGRVQKLRPIDMLLSDPKYAPDSGSDSWQHLKNTLNAMKDKEWLTQEEVDQTYNELLSKARKIAFEESKPIG